MPGGAYTPSAAGANDLYANVQAYRMGDEFEHIDISGRLGLDEKLVVSVLKDPIGAVRRMLADPVGKAVLRPTLVMDDSGQRVYNEMWTADKWMADQVRRTALLSVTHANLGTLTVTVTVGHVGRPGAHCVHHDLV